MTQLIVGSIVVLLVTLGWGNRSLGEQTPAPRGELRIVDTRSISRFSVENNIVEHLAGIDYEQGTLVPRLASGWRWRDDRTLEVTLRQGVPFHNGEVVDAEIVRLSWDAYNAYREYIGPDLVWRHFPPETRLEILAPHTLQFVLPAPDAMAPLKLTSLRIVNRQFLRSLDQRAQELQRPRGDLYFGTLRSPGPWGTGPYQVVAGGVQTTTQADQTVLEAHRAYWDKARFPQVQRLVFDHTLTHKEAQERVMTTEGQVDLFIDTRPLDTLRVAQSPFARVVKERSTLTTVLGLFNTRKADSPWHDLRLRQAVNSAINREDFLRYAIKGNGVLVPALLPPGAVGFDATLPPYPFDPTAARRLLREAGYPDGLSLTLIAPDELEVQATVVGKMLGLAGFTVHQQLLDRGAFYQATNNAWFAGPRRRQQPAPWPTWDIALIATRDASVVISPLPAYYEFVFGGQSDWVDDEPPALRELLARLLGTGERAQQQAVAAQMERHIRDQALFLFLYAPIQLYAVNKEVNFVPHPSGLLYLPMTSVTEQHWSVRQQTTTMHE
jgi:peptide/nickel transport system substrate-binding protein